MKITNQAGFSVFTALILQAVIVGITLPLAAKVLVARSTLAPVTVAAAGSTELASADGTAPLTSMDEDEQAVNRMLRAQSPQSESPSNDPLAFLAAISRSTQDLQAATDALPGTPSAEQAANLASKAKSSLNALLQLDPQKLNLSQDEQAQLSSMQAMAKSLASDFSEQRPQ